MAPPIVSVRGCWRELKPRVPYTEKKAKEREREKEKEKERKRERARARAQGETRIAPEQERAGKGETGRKEDGRKKGREGKKGALHSDCSQGLK
jgi:hypothetical protein